MTMVRTCPACADTVSAVDVFCEGCGRALPGPEPSSKRSHERGAVGPDSVPTTPQESLAGAMPWEDVDSQATRPFRRRTVARPEGSESAPESSSSVPEGPSPATGGGPIAERNPGRCAWCPGRVREGYCDACGLLQPTGRDHVEVRAKRAFGVSDRGLRHEHNEDAMAIRVIEDESPHAPGAVIAVVCDGVSSSPRSDEASRVTAETGATVLAERIRRGDDPKEATGTAMTRAAQAVAAIADSPESAPACTFVSAVTDPRTGSVTVGWVGDSRAYWLSGGPDSSESALLTRDDSWSEAMVQMGALSREEAMRSANAHALIAWMGADSGEIDAHVRTVTPTGPGSVVLCSDGLWNYYPEAKDLADAVPGAGRSPLEAARAYVGHALKAGGRDNITVVVIPMPPGEPRAEPV
ncbi:PP2C family protein-serine/threonine phosphatase [Nocardiopsis alkaliphila]|uniref:PP2C family protein-serine/threonine phosphatase n=1 Tax=Nocardiopsis alkaliphila TaxID=225762 RepID=UPI0004760A08|nr:PP2C family serine/threonine-protein phosphatase [Nocardiopsis alkaliphila]